MHVMAYMSLFTFWADVIPKKQAYEVMLFCNTHFAESLFQTHSGESVKVKYADNKREYYAKYY